MGEEISEVLLFAAQVSQFCEEVEMPLVIASEEEKEGVDGPAVEGAEFDRRFRKGDGDDVERLLEQEIAGVGYGDSIRKGGRH